MRSIVALAALVCPSLVAADAAVALESVHQAACVGCHARITGGDGSLLYGRSDGLVGDIASLRVRTAHCLRGAGRDATEAQVDAFVAYLNQHFYHFTQSTR